MSYLDLDGDREFFDQLMILRPPPYSPEEIAELTGYTATRIRQIEKLALAKMARRLALVGIGPALLDIPYSGRVVEARHASGEYGLAVILRVGSETYTEHLGPDCYDYPKARKLLSKRIAELDSNRWAPPREAA